MICDLGGFVASIIKRGVKFINVPTTFMAQIDASIGGKVAVNLNNYKNQIGVFSNPESVVVYPAYNQSLDDFDFHTNSIIKLLGLKGTLGTAQALIGNEIKKLIPS